MKVDLLTQDSQTASGDRGCLRHSRIHTVRFVAYSAPCVDESLRFQTSPRPEV